MQQENQQLHARIDELESKIAFQEATIEQLNDALSQQQIQIQTMTEQFHRLVERYKSLHHSQIASQAEETPPPHY